jgi:hypothetical protein
VEIVAISGVVVSGLCPAFGGKDPAFRDGAYPTTSPGAGTAAAAAGGDARIRRRQRLGGGRGGVEHAVADGRMRLAGSLVNSPDAEMRVRVRKAGDQFMCGRRQLIEAHSFMVGRLASRSVQIATELATYATTDRLNLRNRSQAVAYAMHGGVI